MRKTGLPAEQKLPDRVNLPVRNRLDARSDSEDSHDASGAQDLKTACIVILKPRENVAREYGKFHNFLAVLPLVKRLERRQVLVNALSRKFGADHLFEAGARLDGVPSRGVDPSWNGSRHGVNMSFWQDAAPPFHLQSDHLIH
jgi:hypothetical protein